MILSIITINLNSTELQKTLQSVAIQTYSNFEHIIIDGGSTGDTISLIREYSKSTSYPVLWVSEPDNGIYSAQNKGIRMSRGKYCFFLNAGDSLINKTVLSKIFSGIISADVIYGNLIIKNKEKTVEICKGKENLTFLDLFNSELKHQAAFINRELFDKYGYYDESLKIVADWAFFLKVVGYKGATTLYIDLDISNFDNTGISYQFPEVCQKERQRVLDQYMPVLLQKELILLQKYRGIHWIEESKTARFLYRLLAFLFKPKTSKDSTRL